MSDAPAPHCPVCCGDLETAVVYCSRCSTPHHDECWAFSGQCAIYGCASQQFTGNAGAAVSEAPLELEEDATLPARRPRETRPVPASDGAVEVALGKRDAFRRWLRDLLDEGFRVPRLWKTGRVPERRLALREDEEEESTRRQGSWLVKLLWGFLPVILLLVRLGDPGAWTAFEIGAYVLLTFTLQVGFDTAVRRELVVSSAQEVQLVTRTSFGSRRRKIASLRGIAAVGYLVQGNAARELMPGVVLLDYQRRVIPIPALELPPGRSDGPDDDDLGLARRIARFLGVSFTGAIDLAGRRRRLPAANS